MENVSELFIRLVGPVAFAIAIMIALIYYSQLTALQNVLFQEATEQPIVTQMMPEGEADRVQYADLLGRLVGGVTEDTMISIPDQMIRILIRVDADEYTATVMEGEQVVWVGDCKREDWQKMEFPYHYVDNAEYRMIATYYNSGAIKTITYVKVV